MQEVQLDSKVKLLDSPGMVLASGNMTDASVALRNAVRVDALDDPVTPVQAILQRYKASFPYVNCASTWMSLNTALQF